MQKVRNEETAAASAIDHRWLLAARLILPPAGFLSLLLLRESVFATWFAIASGLYLAARIPLCRVLDRYGPTTRDTVDAFVGVVVIGLAPALALVSQKPSTNSVALLMTMAGLMFLWSAFRNRPMLGVICTGPMSPIIYFAITDELLSRDQAIVIIVSVAAASIFALLTMWFSRLDARDRQVAHDKLIKEVSDARDDAMSANAALASSNSQLEVTLQSVPAGVALYDADDRLVRWNERYALAAAKAGIIPVAGSRFVELLDRSVRQIEAIENGRAPSDAVRERLLARKTGEQLVQQQSDGKWLQLQDSATPDGGIVSVTVDITDIKTEQEFSNGLFLDSPTPMWLINPRDLSFIEVNRAAEVQFGWSQHEFAQKTIFDLLSPAELDNFGTERKVIMRTEVYRANRPWRYRRRAGGELWIEPHARWLTARDGRKILLAAMWNVSDQVQSHERLKSKSAEAIKAKQIAEASSAAKSEFLAMMSHELRTPLNGILGTAQALQRAALGPDEQTLVDLIVRSGRSLTGTLNDVLDLAKIEAGRTDVSLDPVNLGQLVSDTTAAWADVTREKGVSFRVNVEDGLPHQLLIDSTMCRQVLNNLISNAVKFTSEGEITVSAGHADGVAGRIFLSVSDTGIGMARKDLGRLFQPFTQLKTGKTRVYGGTGLGLSICKRFVELMGGEVSVRSRLGEGSTFAFWLPLVVAAARSEVVGDEEEIDLPAKLSILIAEDNPTNQAVIRALLGAIGWELSFVENGQMAVEAFTRSTFDLVLMDIHMPVMDGIAATAGIRSASESGAAVPIIALTADASAADRDKFIGHGFHDHVAKPVEFETLLIAIARAVQHRPASEAGSIVVGMQASA